jgi:hypothetical protein
MSAITGKDEVSKELAVVQSKLDEATKRAEKFEGADLVMALETRLIRRSQWANRNPAEFLSPEFRALKGRNRERGRQHPANQSATNRRGWLTVNQSFSRLFSGTAVFKHAWKRVLK